MKIGLSEAQLKDAIKKIEELSKNMKSVDKNITAKLVKLGEQYANQYNNMAPRSGTQKPIVQSSVEKNANEGYVALFGPQAVYDEFGTGTEGSNSPHPMKNSTTVPLNPYNSGPVIRANIERYGEAFWHYGPMANQPYFDENGKTYGIPAGKQMYNTARDLNKVKNEVAIKEINAIIKDYNK